MRQPSFNGLTALFIAILVSAFLTGCVTVRVHFAPEPTYAWQEAALSPLGSVYRHQLENGAGASGFHAIVSGVEALDARLALAASAAHTLDIQSFIVRADASSDVLLQALLVAADRGVRVRLLVDDFHAGRDERRLATLSAHENVEVRVYNPFRFRTGIPLSRTVEFMVDPRRLGRRMHNKLWVADGAVAIHGGRNIGNEYFDAHPHVNFDDLDMVAVGPIVADLSASFDTYWNSGLALPAQTFFVAAPGQDALQRLAQRLDAVADEFALTAYGRAVAASAFGQRLASGELPLVLAHGIVLYDMPGKVDPKTDHGHPVFGRRMRALMSSARDEVLLITSYFVPDPVAIDTLSTLARRGVSIKVLTNSLGSTDAPAVHPAYTRARDRLLTAGVRIYERRPDALTDRVKPWRSGSTGASLHAKAVVIDRKHVLLGSMNMDPRSRIHNTELAVLLESETIAAQVEQFFGAASGPERAYAVKLEPQGGSSRTVWVAEEQGGEVRHTKEPRVSWFRRFTTRMLGALVPEHAL